MPRFQTPAITVNDMVALAREPQARVPRLGGTSISGWGGEAPKARHRYRQSQYVGLTRLQLDEIGRERDLQRQGAQQAEARAERAVELAQERVVCRLTSASERDVSEALACARRR